MGFVWAVRRSLRLLTLLTLMASALCSGQSLAAQEIAPPTVAFADSTFADGATTRGSAHALVPATEIFADQSAVTLASATSPAGLSAGPAFAYTAALPTVHDAPAPLVGHFSTPAERAPPAA